MKNTYMRDKDGNGIYDNMKVKLTSEQTGKSAIFYIRYELFAFRFVYDDGRQGGWGFTFDELLEKELGDEINIEVVEVE